MGVDFFGTFPALHPGWLLLIYIIVPWLPIVIGVHIISTETRWNKHWLSAYVRNLVLFMYRFAPIVVIANIFWSSIMCINQASYAYRHMSLNRSPEYLLTVDHVSFNDLAAITAGAIADSYNTMIAVSNNNNDKRRRRLQTASAVDSTLTLSYHTLDFADLTSSNYLQRLCQIELSILQDNSTCINRHTARYDSILAQFFHLPSSCQPINPPIVNHFNRLSELSNARFVQDNMDLTSPSTSVIVSYFDIGTCADAMDSSQFADYLSQRYNNNSANTDLVITYSNPTLNVKEIDEVTSNAGYYLILSAVVCWVVLSFSFRGIVMALLAMFCFFFSLINAAAFLPLLGYDYFSVLNLGAFLILMAYGSIITMIFGSSWRRQVKPATHPTVANILTAYRSVGQTLLYITALGMICCFSLLASPVIIVQQFGSFTAFAILFFYVVFHYVFLPTWVLTSWFILSKRVHRFLRQLRSACCPCYDFTIKFFNDQKGGGWTTAAIIAEFIPEEDEDGAFDDEETVVPGVLPMENIQIIREREEEERRIRGGGNGGESLYRLETRDTSDDNNNNRGMRRGPRGYGSRVSNINNNNSRSESGIELVPQQDDDYEEEGDDDDRYYNNNNNDNEGGEIDEENPGSHYRSLPLTATLHHSQSQSHHVLGTEAPPSATEVVASASPVEEEEEVVPEMTADDNFCRGKRPLKAFGLVVVITVLIGLLIVYIISIQRFRLDLGLSSVNMVHNNQKTGSSSSTNLYYQYQISQSYKYDLLSSHNQLSSVASAVGSFSPTRSPTKAPLSLKPTVKPSAAPSLSPTTGSLAPSRPPTASAYVDYVVSGCYGLSAHKENKDSEVTANYDLPSFQNYAKTGLLQDLYSLCQYVNAHQSDLDIHPDWVMTRDCLYYQYQTASAASQQKTVNAALLTWAANDYLSGSLLGVVSNASLIPTSTAIPVYLCLNFSSRSYMNSIQSSPQTILDKEQQWRDVFSTYAVFAKNQGIAVSVSSPAFTYPVLSHRLQSSSSSALVVAMVAVLVGFSGLLAVFTLLDYGLTLFGSLTIFTVIVVVLCIHLYLVNQGSLDLLDFLAVVCLVMVLSSLPVHLIEEYQAARRHLDRQQTVSADKALSPALAMTNKFFRQSVFGPALLVVLISIAPLYTELEIFRRLSSYLIMIAIVCLVVTICFEPYLLAFGCRTRHFDSLCYVEIYEDEDEYSEGGEGKEAERVISSSSGRQRGSPDQPGQPLEGEEEDEERRSNLSASASAYSMTSSNRGGGGERERRRGRRSSRGERGGHVSGNSSVASSRQSAGVVSLSSATGQGFTSNGSFYRAPMVVGGGGGGGIATADPYYPPPPITAAPPGYPPAPPGYNYGYPGPPPPGALYGAAYPPPPQYPHYQYQYPPNPRYGVPPPPPGYYHHPPPLPPNNYDNNNNPHNSNNNNPNLFRAPINRPPLPPTAGGPSGHSGPQTSNLSLSPYPLYANTRALSDPSHYGGPVVVGVAAPSTDSLEMIEEEEGEEDRETHRNTLSNTSSSAYGMAPVMATVTAVLPMEDDDHGHTRYHGMEM